MSKMATILSLSAISFLRKSPYLMAAAVMSGMSLMQEMPTSSQAFRMRLRSMSPYQIGMVMHASKFLHSLVIIFLA